MAGRPFGSYDVPPIRSEANVDPFTNFVNNGMKPLPTGGSYTPQGWTGGAPNTNATGGGTMLGGAAGASILPNMITSTSPSGILPLIQMLAPILQKMGRPGGTGAAGFGASHPPPHGGPAWGGASFGAAGNPLNNMQPPASATPPVSNVGQYGGPFTGNYSGTYGQAPGASTTPSGPVSLGTLPGNQIAPLLQTIMSMLGGMGNQS